MRFIHSQVKSHKVFKFHRLRIIPSAKTVQMKELFKLAKSRIYFFVSHISKNSGYNCSHSQDTFREKHWIFGSAKREWVLIHWKCKTIFFFEFISINFLTFLYNFCSNIWSLIAESLCLSVSFFLSSPWTKVFTQKLLIWFVEKKFQKFIKIFRLTK